MASTRDHILDTTCDLLEKQGYHATGLNQIVEESGAPKGSLYYYFPDGKEGLTAEAIERAGAAVRERIRASLAEIEDAPEAVRSFILTVAGHVEASGWRAGGPITTVAMETATSSERLSEACRQAYQSWVAAFEEKLLLNHYPPQTAAPLATLIIASMEGAIVLSRTYRSTAPLQHIAAELHRLLVLSKG